MNKLNWIEKELSRRYIVGALLHVNKDLIPPATWEALKELQTDAWGDWGTVDAQSILISRLNMMAEVYELDTVTECKLCRRSCPASGLCESCDRLAVEAENQKAAVCVPWREDTEFCATHKRSLYKCENG